jgi:uncharacterized protein
MMRILIDISHPAHVHFFKNSIRIFKERGHTVKVVSRDKDITIKLLDAININHTPLSTAPMTKNVVEFFKEMVIHCTGLYKVAKQFKPDVMLQIAGTFIAPVGRLLRIPTVGFYDTEFARFSNAISYPLLSRICTPQCYVGEIGHKHVRYPSYHELAYLHPNFFQPNANILKDLGFNTEEKIFIVRFVNWGALHDYGETGFNMDSKIRLAEELSKKGRLLINSEGQLPSKLERYRSNVPIEKLHDVMAFAALVIGESATMASEAAVLGVPSIFISTTGRGYTDEQEIKYNIVSNFKPFEQKFCLEKALCIASMPIEKIRFEYQEKRQRLLRECIDTTSWMVDHVTKSFCFA